MNRKSCLFGRCAAVCLIAVLVSASAAARTVYDAGKAFNEAGHNKNAFGVWSLLHASGDDLATTSAFDTTTGGTSPLVGIGGSTSPWIRVNSGTTTQIQDGEEILPNELYLHPANSGNKCDVVRFTAPETGWYSANILAHDASKESSGSAGSGVEVSIRAAGNILVSKQRVSLEDYASNNPTHRFDFQMPVRFLSAGETIEVVVGPGTAHSNDATGLRFIVTKEDEGSFFDSGIALTNNIATTYANPYGNIKDGTWYYLLASVPVGTDFTNWAPANFNNALTSRISTQATRSDASSQRGFAGAASGTSPYVLVNETAAGSSASTSASSQSSQIAPCELHVHPKASDLNAWPVIRFRPPVSGYYSASIVARDVIRGKPTDTPTPDGVRVYLLVSGAVMTNAYISAETFSSTAHLTFGPRLLVANEPVDIAMFANTSASSDATGISAIFRREPGMVFDVGSSYYEEHDSNRCNVYFSDLADANAKWLLAMKSDPWGEAHSTLDIYLNPKGSTLDWWTHATSYDSYGKPPRFAMATNAIVAADSLYFSPSPLLSTIPYELVVQPDYDTEKSESRSVSLRAEVPSSGVYRVRGYARDLNNNNSGNGVRVIVSANEYAPAAAVVSRDGSGSPYESVLSADRVWLKQGEALYFTVDPIGNSVSDATGLSACYEKLDADAANVINVDFAGAGGAGRLSSYSGVGREGWSDWTRWNALRPGDSAEAAAVNCREADGATRRNATVTIVRGAGNIAKVTANGASMLESYVLSDGADDTYIFTISGLKKDEPYTLYLYSAKGDTDGNAVFTVGGVTKAPDETWNLREKKVLTRFDAVSDSEGRISGTFAAADAAGGAFNGLTIVGSFPDFVPRWGMRIVVR